MQKWGIMSLKFIFGPSGSGKTYHLYHQVIENSIKNPDRNYLVIVPEQFTLQTQKALVTMHPNHGIMNIDVLSFHRLAHRIFDAAGGDDRPILDDTGKSLILRRVASEQEEELKVLSGNLHKLGYINEIKSVISEFVQYDIGLEQLDEMIEGYDGKPILQGKLKDIRVLYGAFESFIHEKYITKEELLDRACVAADRAAFLKNSCVVFDGFTGFTPVQNRFIQCLMGIADEVIITLLMGTGENVHFMDGEQKLFHMSKKTVQTLMKLADEVGVASGNDTYLDNHPMMRWKNAPGLAFLEENLFRYHNDTFTGMQSDIHLLSAVNPEVEAASVCREILKLVRKEGYRYRDIAIVTGDSASYERVLREAMEQYEIPYFYDSTKGILLNPFTEFIRACLEVVTTDFSYESVFHYLKTGLTGFAMEQVDEVQNYVRAFGIRGKNQYRKPWTKKYKDQTEENLVSLNEFREKFYSNMEHLSDVMLTGTEKKGKVKDYLLALYQFIGEHRIQSQLSTYEQYFRTIGEQTKAREFSQIYQMVMDLFDQMMELLSEETVTWKEFSDILDAGFGEIRVGMIPPGVDQVVAGDMQRTRLCEIKALFFMGMNDGMVPKAGGSGGIISEMDREFLQQKDIELSPTTRQQAYIQRLYLYMYLTKPSERLYISYSGVSGDGSTLRPSYFVGTLCRMFPEMETDTEDGNRTYEDILTVWEGLFKITEDIGRNGHTKEFLELYSYLLSEESRVKLIDKMTQLSFANYRADPISRAVARTLYGTVLKNSVTRLEQFASCAYAHFLQYGLRLKEREEFSFDPSDMGSVFHNALEEYSNLLTKSSYSWFDIPQEEAEKLVTEALTLAVREEIGEILQSSARNSYIINRMDRILRRTVSVLTEQVRRGDFVPNEYEVAFSESTDLSTIDVELSEDEMLKLRGRIDRLDTLETADKVYVKVVDYKSGAKSFDLVSVYYGLQLQLVVYMNAAISIEERKHPDKEVIPAGILYYHMDDPIVERGDDSHIPEEKRSEHIRHQLMKELSMKGLIEQDPFIIDSMDHNISGRSEVIPVAMNKDGSISKLSSVVSSEDLKTISDYVNQKTVQLGRDILNGHIEVNPYEMSNHSACEYCGYRAVCGYDETIPGYRKRKLPSAKTDEVLARMSSEGVEKV